MTILLINPPIKNFEEAPYPPLGLAYIAAVLETQNFDVEIFDMPILNKDVNDCKKQIETKNPKILGITCMTRNYSYAVEIAKIAKKINKEIKIVLGGPHATFLAEEILKNNKDIDIIVNGEGEITFLKLVRNILTGNYNLSTIKGITYRGQSGEIINTQSRPFIKNLDALPFPARHLLPMADYRNKADGTTIITSRGCPYSCVYCVNSAMWRRTIRVRDPAKVVDEISHVRDTWNIKHFIFADNIFTFDGKKVKEFCYELEKRGTDITWECTTRADRINSDILNDMKNAGCTKISFGVETLNPQIQKIIRKNLDIEKAKKNIIIAKKIGLRVKLNFMFGLPEQTTQDFVKSLKFIKKASPDIITLSVLTPYPGTTIYQNFKDFGLKLRNVDWRDYDFKDPLISNAFVEWNEINEIIDKCIKTIDVRTPTMAGIY